MCLWKNGPSTMLTLLTHPTGQEGIFCMLMSKILIIHYTYTSHPSHCLWFSEKVPEQSLRFNDILKGSRIFSIILESILSFRNILSSSRSFNKLINYLYINRYAHTSWSSHQFNIYMQPTIPQFLPSTIFTLLTHLTCLKCV